MTYKRKVMLSEKRSEGGSQMSVPHKKCSNKGETFVISVKCRQNHTWQGTVKWIEGQKEIPFRSVFELIKLIDSAIELEEKEAEW